MFDPVTDRKVALCEVAAQMGADGSIPPCAAARLAVAQELQTKAAYLRRSALRADKTLFLQRDNAHADELDKTARQLAFEAKTCAGGD